jgi:hypothetical protein
MDGENTIYFYPGQGGHSHNGENSSFIDTSKYSLFDFSWGFLGDPSRISSQTMNYNSFQNFIVETINNAVLKPAGLVLQPGVVNGSAHIISRSIEANTIVANTLTANEISANTITSNELAANFVLVNTIIASGDFNGTFDANTFALSNTGTDGWAITSSGDAVFTNGIFRGNLIVGADDYWYSNGAFALGGNTGIYRNVGGGITLGGDVTILGGVIASAVSTPGIDIDSAGNLTAGNFSLYADGSMYASGGNFQVDASGNLFAENAQIRGEISSDTFVTHSRFNFNNNWTVPTVQIDNAANEFSLNTTGGGIRMNGDRWYAYRSGGTFNYLDFNFSTASYFLLGEFYVDGNITAAGELQGGDIISYGKGVTYNASNLQGGFAIAFGYDNGSGELNALVDNNAGVSFYLTKTGASDRRLKDNIEPISSAVLDKFYSIKTYEFDWNDKAPQYMQNTGRSVGVIADELKGLYPSAVHDSGSYEGWVHRYDEHPEGFSLEEMEKFDSDYYEFVPGEGVWQKPRYASVNYTVLVPHLISAVHDLNNRIKELESKV